jgi:LytS/YehU family sensor histidine kinase
MNGIGSRILRNSLDSDQEQSVKLLKELEKLNGYYK